jgi:phenylacetate-CoA ligase
MPINLIRQRQQTLFQSVVDHFLRTPFYAGKLAPEGIDLRAIEGLDGLAGVPFTTKRELRDTAAADRSPCSMSQLEFIFSSSGTTGEPTTYYWTRNDTAVLREVGGRAMKRVGVSADDLTLVITPLGLPVMWYCMVQQYNAVNAGIMAPGIQSPDTLLTYLAEYPVTVLITLPVVASRLFEYARYYRPELLSAIHLRQIHCGGDFLSEARRRRLEKSWGARCYNFLGMSEILGPLAGEGPDQAGLQLDWANIYMEVIDPATKQPAAPGEPGVAVYTTLWPKGAPLLRYWSDDFVSAEEPTDLHGEPQLCLHYLGRSSDRLVNQGRSVFARDIEDCILAYPVGDEWRLETGGDGPAILSFECPSGAEFDTEALRDAVGALIGQPVDLEISLSGSFSRDEPKPARIIRRS